MNEINYSEMLYEIMEYKRFETKAEFAKFLGIKPNVLSNWFSRNTLDKEIILNKIPELNKFWLMTREGEMILNGAKPYPEQSEDVLMVAEPEIKYESAKTQDEKLIASLELNVKLMSDQIKTLQTENSDLLFENMRLHTTVHLSKSKLEKFRDFFQNHKDLEGDLIKEKINIVAVDKIVEQMDLIDVISDHKLN